MNKKKTNKKHQGIVKISMTIKQLLLTSFFVASTAVSGAEKFTVQDIKVEGLQRVALGAALLRIPVRVGEVVSQKDVSDIIKALYRSGNFENVKVLRDDNVLVVQVRERPMLASISFSGNSAIKEEQLQQNLEASGVRIGEALDRTTLSKIEKGLEDFYYSVGKYNATVKAVITPLSRNRADLKFIFSGGASAKIQQINFIGNEAFKDSELLSLFDLNADVAWWNFLSDDKYQKQVLAADLEAVKSYYLNQGYLKFEVDSAQVSISPDKKGVYITLHLNEGKPYAVESVKFRGELIDKKSEFEQMVPFEEGSLYSGTLITGLEENIKKVLGEAGYAYPKVYTQPEFDDDEQKVSLVVHVEAGHRIYVRNIRFVGNNLTKDEVMRREMRQMEGSWLNSKAVETSKSRLNRLGFFENVNVQTVRVPGTNDQVDLVYTVKEANSGSINFGVGYGTESGISFQAGLQQDNFVGSGDRVGISAMMNDYQRNVTLEYRDPYWNLDGVSLGGKVFYNKFEASEAGIVDYTNKSYGANLTWGFPFDELNFFEIGLGYTHNRISNLDSYVQIEQFLQAQKENMDSSDILDVSDFDMTLSWTRNNLNRGYFPTAGNHQRAYYKATFPSSDVQYFKVQYDVRQYYPLTKKHDFSLLLRGRLGYGSGYGTSDDGNDYLFPFYENFYAGGFSSLRGFGSNSVGPKTVYDEGIGNNPSYTATDDSVGGNAIALGSVELIVPTPFASEEMRSQIRTSVFFDMASVWDTEFNYLDSAISYGKEYYYDYSDPANYRSSYGLALQWMSPMGPLVFSFAKPVKVYRGDDDEFFTFTIGQTF